MADKVPLGPLAFVSAEIRSLQKNWGWFLALGIALIVLGMLAIAMPVIPGLAVVAFLAVLLIIAGVGEIMGAFQSRCWGAFFLNLLIGIVYIIVGMLMISRPLLALESITILVAAALLVTGVFRIVWAVTERFDGWGWVLLGGAIDIFLALLIWAGFPESALWVIGLFLGISMIYNGVIWVSLAMAMRSVPRPGEGSPARM